MVEQPVAPVEAAPSKPVSLLPPPELIQKTGPTITPRKKILQQDATLPFVQPSLSKPKESDLFPHVTPVAENLPSDIEENRLESILRTPDTTSLNEENIPLTTMAPLAPLTVLEDVVLESATAPGMGEILAEQSTSGTLLQNQDARPWLHGPYLSPAGSKKRLPSMFSNWLAIGVSFLLIDLFIFFIFRVQITGFFREENRPSPITQAPPAPVVTKPVKATPTASTKAEDKTTPLRQDEPKPLAPLPIDKAAPPDTVQFTPVPPVMEVPKAVAIPPVTLNPVPAEAQSALEALQKFLEAPTWNERAAYVQKPEMVKPLMEKYASKSGDGPIIVGSINFASRFTNDKGAHCTFEVSGGSLPHPVMAVVEQPSNATARVDWETFVEFKDDLLLKFLESNGAPNQKFRVTMQRIHYFDKDVPEQDNKDSFGIRQPNSLFEGHIFLDKESALATQLATQLPWGKDLLIIAELTWKTNGKNHWVELQAIPSYGWRY